MISPAELAELMADLESDRIERTESTNNTDKFSQAVCAFANDLPNHKQPGYLVIGVDKFGVPTGLDVTEKLLANARSFDTSPIRDAAMSDLSASLFQAYRQEVIDPEVIEANHRSLEDQLASLRFYDSRHHVPTVAGLLLFGKNPRYYLPGAYIQFLRLPGTTLTERPDDEAEISGDLLSVLRELDARIKVNNITKPVAVSTLRETSLSAYPDVAIREIVLNAVMHRDYQSNTPIKLYWFTDRIEVHSPGGLYGEVTPSTLESRSSYRNPVLAETMKALGYVNRYGYGIQRAQAAMAKNSSPAVQFEIDDRTVLAILPGKQL
ncbi:MAG: ATP-binding protein [Pseudohongiella sp.]|nr:ATP-binding protein [Pseudohongiella sp.]